MLYGHFDERDPFDPGRKERTMPYDLVIKHGTVIDGSGLPRYRADVGVRHGA